MTDLYNNNWNIGLSVSYPLSSLFKNGHKIKESQLQVAVQKKEEELKKQQLQMDIYNAILRHKEALQEEEAWELSVRQAQENYRIMQNRYMNQLAILPLHEPAGHTHRPAGCQFRVAQCRATVDFFAHQNHLHLLPAAKSLRKIITSLNYKEYDATRYTQETPEKKTAEHPAQLSMYSDCRLRTDMGGQLLLEIHSL